MDSLVNRHDLLTTWRRVLFYTWVIAAIFAAAAAMIAGPVVTSDGGDDTTWVALISPVAMAVFVITGVIWLVLLAFLHGSKAPRQRPN